MKRFLLVIFIFHFHSVKAQTNKKFILRSNFGYNYSYNDALDSPYSRSLSSVSTKEQIVNAGLNAGRKLKSNFYYGIGLSYSLTKLETNPLNINVLSSSTGYSVQYPTSSSKSITNSVVPYIFMQYFKGITDKLFLSVDIFSRYSFNKSHVKTSTYGLINQINSTTINAYRTDSEQQYIEVGFNPALRFNFFNNLGLELVFANITYQQKTLDSRGPKSDNKSKEFNFSLTPENWLIGIYMYL